MGVGRSGRKTIAALRPSSALRAPSPKGGRARIKATLHIQLTFWLDLHNPVGSPSATFAASLLSPHQSRISIHQAAAHVAGGEFIRADFGDGGYLGGTAYDETFIYGWQFVWHDAAFIYCHALGARHFNHRLADDTIEEAIGDRRVDLAIFGEEDIADSSQKNQVKLNQCAPDIFSS